MHISNRLHVCDGWRAKRYGPRRHFITTDSGAVRRVDMGGLAAQSAVSGGRRGGVKLEP